MSEFNIVPPYRGAINPWDAYSILESLNALGASPAYLAASAAWPSGSLAIFVPFYLNSYMSVGGVYWVNGAAVNGQIDCGVYDANGNRVFSIGSVLQSGTSAMQETVISPAVHLAPGLYYMALSAANAAATFRASSGAMATGTMGKVLGMAQAAASFPLPAAPTLISAGQDYIPLFGITSEPTQVQ